MSRSVPLCETPGRDPDGVGTPAVAEPLRCAGGRNRAGARAPARVWPNQYGCTPTGAAGGGPYPSAMRWW
ncbi:hypothetical protein SUDANB99_01749 [Streptomyces sp. enrichment culture]